MCLCSVSATIGMSGKFTLKRPALFWSDCKGSIWQSFPFTCENEHALHYSCLNIPESAVRALIFFIVELTYSEDW